MDQEVGAGGAVGEFASRQAAPDRIFARLRRSDPVAAEVIVLAASARRVAVGELLRQTRSGAEIAAARQLAMYLIHVMLGRTLTDIGVLFGRDRTTVAHACRLMEDRRDDNRFDAEVNSLEMAVEALSIAGSAVREACHAAR